MFLSIDKKDPRKTAAIDSAGRKCTYGDLVCFSRDLRKMIPGRELVMVLSQNDIPTLFLYLGCMINRIVPILIGNTMEKDAIKNLIEKYKPAYIAGQKELLEELKFEGGISLWEKEETILVHNTEERPVLYPELSLLLTTSGSTGSPKLVRHSYDNIEKQAGNIAAFFKCKFRRQVCHPGASLCLPISGIILSALLHDITGKLLLQLLRKFSTPLGKHV